MILSSNNSKPSPTRQASSKSLLKEFLSSESIFFDTLGPFKNQRECLDISSLNMMEYLNQKVDETFNEAIDNIIKIKETLKHKITIIFSFGCSSENTKILYKELQILRSKIIENNYPIPLLQHFSVLLNKYKKVSHNGFVPNIDNVKNRIQEYLDLFKEETTELVKRGLENVEKWSNEAVKQDIKNISAPKETTAKPFYQLKELNPANFKAKIQTGLNFTSKKMRTWAFIHKLEDGSKGIFMLSEKGRVFLSYKIGCLDNTGNWAKDDVKFVYWEERNMFLLGEKISREILSLSFFKIIKGRLRRITSYKVTLRKTRVCNTFDLAGDRGLLIVAKGTVLKICKIGMHYKNDIKFQEPIVLVRYLKELKCIAVVTINYLYVKEINDQSGFGRILHKIPINIEEREIYELLVSGNILLLKRQEGFIGVELVENGYRLFEKKWTAKEKVTRIVIFPLQKLLLIGLHEANPRIYDYWQERYIECRLWNEKVVHPKIEFVSEDAEIIILRTSKLLYECILKK